MLLFIIPYASVVLIILIIKGVWSFTLLITLTKNHANPANAVYRPAKKRRRDSIPYPIPSIYPTRVSHTEKESAMPIE
ncbi:hypothetical protein EJ08DRAFT_387531 [Tothia fuscella]|uniref:Uncharacterized protein n=1 Tax=Tothia fuscella TaxID=1048955 RepID=A0A9P4P0H4_9PEZI|nr:hypothetical protein EJ08DRAFT_387531 [Tothia fuscella]